MGEHKARLIVVLLLILSWSSLGSGTIGIVAYSSTTFWIVTDGRQTDPWGNPTGTVCKIRQGAGFYWVAVTTFYRDERLGFSLPLIVDSIPYGEGTLPSRLDQLLPKLAVPLAAELRRLKTDFVGGPASTLQLRLMCARYVTGQQFPLEIAFVSLDKNKRPSLAWLDVQARDISGIVYIEGVSKQGIPVTDRNPVDFFMIGPRDVAEPFLKGAVEHWTGQPSPAELMREAVRREEEVPGINFVGGPISVLQVDENGPLWIELGACK